MDGPRRAARGYVAELLVEHVEGELDGVQRIPPPVLLRVLLRVRVLHGEAVGERRVERGAIRVAQVGGEVRSGPGSRRVGASPVHQVHGIPGHVVHAHSASLVRVRHRAAVLESPFACRGDRAVDAPGTRRRAGDDARVVHVEAGRDLHHHRGVHLARALVVVRDRFLAGDLPFAQGIAALRIDVGAVEHAVATRGGRVHQRAVVLVDGQPAQLRGGGAGRIREARGRRREREARLAQSARQEVVGVARVGGRQEAALHERRPRVQIVVGSTGSEQNDEQRQHLPHGNLLTFRGPYVGYREEVKVGQRRTRALR